MSGEYIKKAAQYIESDLFRPPHGRMKTSQQNEIRKNYNIVLWDVLSFDFNNNLSNEMCFNNVKHFTRPGSVIVFHDNIKSKDNMFYAKPILNFEFAKYYYTKELIYVCEYCEVVGNKYENKEIYDFIK